MLSKSFVKTINEKYGNSSDIVIRRINDITYIYLESVSSDDKISNFLLKSITNLDGNNLFETLKNNIFNSHVEVINKIDDVYYYLSAGYTCIHINNENKFIVVETKAKLDRGVNSADTEPIIRGPKDSFTENHVTNLGLIRKRIKDNNLWFEEIKIGVRTDTKITIVYINGIAETDRVDKIKKKLEKVKIDGILDSGNIRGLLEDKNKSAFPKIISTERPDVTVSGLLNGKIAVLIENSPFALIMPGVLNDFIRSPEDYYQKPINASFSRSLRTIAFFISIITPALYLALMTFNQEIIPNELLISLANQREGVPFPTAIEILLFMITFEILRESDLRSPNNSGATMSIVGALVLGDAAVQAGVVSPIVIIVVAMTSICELSFSDVDIINAIREWRLVFIFAAAIQGLIGFIAISLILVLKLVSLESLGVPYLTPYSPLNIKALKDGIIRFPIKKLKDRPSYLTDNLKKLGDNNEN